MMTLSTKTPLLSRSKLIQFWTSLCRPSSLWKVCFCVAMPPPELEIVGITCYREIHVHPWRIIYEALEAVVHAHWIFDSRRYVAGQFAQKMLRGSACYRASREKRILNWQ